LSLPALIGVRSRSHLGFVLAPDTPLRKTPTAEADTTPLAAGEAARVERTRRDYLLIRTSHASGWIRAEELGMLCPRRS